MEILTKIQIMKKNELNGEFSNILTEKEIFENFDENRYVTVILIKIMIFQKYGLKYRSSKILTEIEI